MFYDKENSQSIFFGNNDELGKEEGKGCLIVEKIKLIVGNIYTENVEVINFHKYGAHIFHTDSKKIRDYVNEFAEFNRYTNCPVDNWKGQLYNLPFNMNTFNKIWPDVATPEQVKESQNGENYEKHRH